MQYEIPENKLNEDTKNEIKIIKEKINRESLIIKQTTIDTVSKNMKQ